MSVSIYLCNNLPWLRRQPAEFYDLIYIDPPFNTGKTQRLNATTYEDKFESPTDYLAFVMVRIAEAKRVLKPNGSIFVHLDHHEVHYVKVQMDALFGRACFQNEVIWAYDYGARSTRKWSTKHDSILWYSKDRKDYTFNLDEVDRIPYMAPGLVGPEKAARGKTPTDTWWHTIVPTNGHERVDYPTQKPRGIIDRIVKVHSNPGDQLLDFFAGSGTFGESAALLKRNVTLVDENPQAFDVMRERLKDFQPLSIKL